MVLEFYLFASICFFFQWASVSLHHSFVISRENTLQCMFFLSLCTDTYTKAYDDDFKLAGAFRTKIKQFMFSQL